MQQHQPQTTDVAIIGAGPVGIEMAEQAQNLGLTLDDVVVCCSGGGLTAGIVIAMTRLAPHAGVWTAEPEAYDDHRRSLETGRRQRTEPGRPDSICDASMACSRASAVAAFMNVWTW